MNPALLLHHELLRTARLCQTLAIDREALQQLPADLVDELLTIEDARQDELAELARQD